MRRPQFNLKALFIVMTLVVLGCLGVTLERWRRIRQQEARETENMLQRVRVGEPGSTTMRVFDE